MVEIEEPTAQTLYEQIGGADKLRELVDRFYDLMALESEFGGILKLHPSTLTNSRDKLYWFLSGWMGGPNLYIEQFGHPRLRARHLPFKIGIAERNQWLICMKTAMVGVQIEENLQERLLTSFYETADWMRNQDG
jgi:hemoglobin